jgi:hypothetical protein
VSRTTRRWWLVGIGAASAVVVGVGVAAWTYGQDAWWHAASAWPLDEAERASVEACQDPGWMGLLRLVEQDLDDTCPADWYAAAAAEHLKKRHVRRIRWLRDLSRDPLRSERTHFRAATALLLAGHETLPGLAVLTRRPSLTGTRERLAEVIALGGWPSEWGDPDLRGDAALWALEANEDDALALAAVVARLRHEALFDDGDPGRRERLADRGLAVMGLDGGLLESAIGARERGRLRPLLPEGLQLAVVNRGQACRERASSTCLLFVAELLEARLDGGELPDRPKATLPMPLWEVLYDDRPGSAELRGDLVGAAGAWVADSPEKGRPERLLDAIAGGGSDRSAAAGDPAAVLRWHAGPPWTTALTALALGEVSGVDVAVAADGAGVWIRLDKRNLRLQPCGVRLPVGDADAPGRAWPAEAVLAQAALEAAAELGGDDARRVARLAARIDTIGAGPVGAAFDGPDPGSPGRAAAAAVRPPPGREIVGAEAERAAVGVWAAEHALDRLACSEPAP